MFIPFPTRLTTAPLLFAVCIATLLAITSCATKKPDKFWFLGYRRLVLQTEYRREKPIQAGLFDLNRYQNW